MKIKLEIGTYGDMVEYKFTGSCVPRVGETVVYCDNSAEVRSVIHDYDSNTVIVRAR